MNQPDPHDRVLADKGRCRYWPILIFLAILGIGILPISSSLHARRGSPSARGGTNLLIIIADDQASTALGLTGDRRGATPSLDALARQGVSFDRAYCNSPLCTPSRQSLITGLLPHAVGVTQLTTSLPETALTLGHWLAARGFRTAAIGKMHFNNPSHHGFAERVDVADWVRDLKAHPPRGGDRRHEFRPFVDPPEVWLNAECKEVGLPAESMTSTYFVDRAIEFVKRDRQQPFALVVGFYEPHAPFRFPTEWKGRYRPDQFPVPPISNRDREERPLVFKNLSDAQVSGIQAAYYSSVSYIDDQIGRLIKALDESGLGRDTLVVFLSDNGYMLGQHGRFEKHCFYEPAVRVPLMMRWAGHLPAGRRVPCLVELVDVLPTVCQLLNIPAPPGVQGMDLTPLIEGKPGARCRPVAFSEYTENEEAMVRSDRYKLVVGTGRRHRKDHLENGQPLPGPYQRLYDETSDPDENNDLAGDPKYEKLKERLLESMYDRLLSTRSGLDPVPPGLSRLETIHWCLVPRDR